MAKKKKRLTKRSEQTDRLPSDEKGTFLCAASVLAGALLLYACTLAPTVTLVDSGELIVAAHSLGVAHPPGFPLYVLLAHLASVVPIGNIAARVNFASAVFAALAAGMLTLVVSELILLLNGRTSRIQILVPSVAAGLLLACSRTLWAYATIAEVYTLNTLLIVSILFLMLRWRRRRDDRVLFTAAVLFGLGLGVHHVTLGLVLPAIAVLVYRSEGMKFFASRRLVYAGLLSLGAVILVYSYLPIAAARDPILNWGNPRSLSGIWRHLSGWQYQSYFEFDAKMLGAQVSDFARMLLREFGPGWLPLTLAVAAAGVWVSFKRDRRTFWLLLLIVVLNAGYAVTYPIAEDKDAYYLPTFIAVTLFAALGIYAFASSKVTAPISLILPLLALVANWPFDNRSHYFIAEDYVANIQRSLGPNALLLTLDWQVASPMLYTREIEGKRRDVKVVDVNLLRRSWYVSYLERAYPEMMERSRTEIAAYTADLRAWEDDPAAFARDQRLTRQISSAFIEMCEALVRHERSVAPVCLTRDVLLMPGAESQPVVQWLNASYGLVPKGLVFEVETDRTFIDPGPLRLETRGLADGTLRFEDDDVVKVKVLPAYVGMLINRGRYFTFWRNDRAAAEAFQFALQLDPHATAAQEGLAKLAKP